MITEKHSSKNKKEDEIDLLAIIKTVWDQRKKIISIVMLFFVIGFFIAVYSPKEYTATSTFIPQISESGKGGGSLGGLASLAGINLGPIGGSSEIPPSLYPKFISSVKFRKELLEASINVEGIKTPVSYSKYFEEINEPGILSTIRKYTIGLPKVIIKELKGAPKEPSFSPTIEGDLVKLSANEVAHFNRLVSQLSITPNDNEGIVSLSFVMPEPLMAAQMAQFAQELLQKEVIAYKISNAKEQLKFTEERFEEKKAEFEQIQARLSSFRDRNQNIVSASAQNQLQRLEAEYNFAFNIYTELAKQLEQAKLQVSKDTPIFSVIQPVTIPTEKSAPKRPLILVIFTILGFIFGLVYVFGSEFLKGVKEQWNQV